MVEKEVPAENINSGKKIAVCGGGLVGCLAACYFAKRGYSVTLYEYRSDIRLMKQVAGRSINMAMSVRGREALRQIGAEESITSKGIEMFSRMLHNAKGDCSAVPYGKATECILSIDRRYLNELLLTEAESYKNVKIVYNHKLLRCNTDTGDLKFENTETKEVIDAESDFIVGCDGAYSVVRQSLMKAEPLDYAQEYISSYYLELHMPAKEKTQEHIMPPKHLHIWPRGDFMLIALPNQDGSFTCTLFMPLAMFGPLTTHDTVITFFRKYFTDAVDLIGEKHLVDTFFASKPLPMISIKCDPHHGKRCVLLGDSAHAMVPFYGQGMNCGFEDCIVFFEKLDKCTSTSTDDSCFSKIIGRVVKDYSKQRVPDAHAMCDLAHANYTEMSHTVTTRAYQWRKKLDGWLNWFFPATWIPLYTMVTFSRIRYSDVVERKKQQDKIVKKGINLTLATALTGLTALAILKGLKHVKF